jgi:Arylsulfatase A and related enzymes
MYVGEHWYRRGKVKVAGEDLARDETFRFLKDRPKKKPFALTIAFYPPKPIGVSNKPGKQWEPKNETRAIYENLTIPEPLNATEAFKRLPPFLQKGEAYARWKQRYVTPLHYQEAMKNMYALITQVDQACKEIIDEIKKQGLYNNTMIIFTTDNGMFNGAHGLAGKWYPYQESIRVPLIIYDPRMPKDKIGTIDDSFTLNVDVAETILGAAGLKPTKGMQGRDISDLYLPKKKNEKTALERKPWRKEFFYEFTYMEESAIPSSKALVRKQWKFIDWYLFNHTQLFNLDKDPLEINDVKNDPANSEVVKEMKARLKELTETLREPDIGCETGDYFLHSKEATPKERK